MVGALLKVFASLSGDCALTHTCLFLRFVLIFKISFLENVNVFNFKKRAYFGFVCLVCLKADAHMVICGAAALGYLLRQGLLAARVLNAHMLRVPRVAQLRADRG